MAMPRFAFAQAETIKVGVLHSLSGTMAISETTLKDTMLMLIEAQNAKGWKPAQPRPRKVSAALKAYAKLVMSADKGAVRDLSLLDD